MNLLRYTLADGVIDGMYTANTEALLRAQIIQGDAEHGYLLCETDEAIRVLEADYRVVNGQLVRINPSLKTD